MCKSKREIVFTYEYKFVSAMMIFENNVPIFSKNGYRLNIEILMQCIHRFFYGKLYKFAIKNCTSPTFIRFICMNDIIIEH